jgi:hypothetical protein
MIGTTVLDLGLVGMNRLFGLDIVYCMTNSPCADPSAIASMNPPAYLTVVPVYKATPSKSEAFSFLQLREIQVKNVTLMCPEGLDIRVYQDLWPEVQVARFTPEHFLSVQTYNDFMLDPQLYETFAQHYQWMLVYQLDAFIFSNRIEEFCKLGYDYFGAPWRVGFPKLTFLFNRFPVPLTMKRFYVGNGGFSLRNIPKTIDLLNRTRGHISRRYFMEDVFFGYWGSIDFQFHACPAEVGASFSCETHPDHWLKITGQFPMGTHNFERVGPEWAAGYLKPFIAEAWAKLLQSFPKLGNF